MRHLTLTSRGIALTISFFVFFACCSNIILAQGPTITQQSNCFSITLVHGDTVSIGVGCDSTATCGSPGFQCGRCIDVKICSDKCPGLDPVTFTVTSTGTGGTTDCHAVCSPTGDFVHGTDPLDPGAVCSWYNPRTMVYLSLIHI